MYIMSLCTVALIHDATGKINMNIKVFSKTLSILCFQLGSISKAPKPVPHHCNFMLLSLGFCTWVTCF